ncbi:MAG: hypothetical protein JSS14_10190 [Proteobacteria bacterium]|nr:hypothetical protein [Pseudomonadota bacterium]
MTSRRCAASGAGVALAVAFACVTVHADAASDFSTAPMLVDGKIPAPNVLLAIDGDLQPAQFPQAVRRSFGAERAPDASMRLGWQVGQRCEALPDNGALCVGHNAPRSLDDARRNELAALFDALAADSTRQLAGTSAGSLLAKAQAYLQGDVQANPRLACRTSHVLLATPIQDAGDTAPSAPPAPSVRRIDTSRTDATGQLSEAVDNLLAQSWSLRTRTIASLAASSNFTPATTAAPMIFASRFDAARWSGDVSVQALGDTSSSLPAWGQRDDDTTLAHTSASLLDKRTPTTRLILTSHGASGKLFATPFRWAQLAPSQQAALSDGDSLGEQRLDYLRGERNGEQSNGGGFRNRDSRQGDSVNSALWHLPGRPASNLTPARAPMLFLGGNDGMLHAFSADTGAELFAYVPQGAYASLAQLARPSYRHAYLVDGSPWTADMIDESGRSRTLLAGFMGAGGPGYFVLDVTDPVEGLAEADAATRLVLLDTTASQDPDIGRITGAPVSETSGTWQIARLNNGRWAVVIGNGYGSARQQAVLLIQFLDGARELLKLQAGEAGSNGLAAARLVDLDGDRVPDAAYAGDLQGALWKFDLAGRDAGNWKLASGGKPLLMAHDAKGMAQPITAAPLVIPHPAGGRMVVVGTGRLLSDADRSDASTQSIYGVLDAGDAGDAGMAPADRSSLVQQAVAPEPVGMSSGRLLWTSTQQAVAAKPTTTSRGWYLDLPMAGERVIANPQRFDGKLVDVLSLAPSAAFRQTTLPESCEPPATRIFRTTLNALDGARPESQLYGDVMAALNASRIELGSAPSIQLKRAGQERTITFGEGTPQETSRRRLDFVARRAGWRQLQ